MKSFTTVSILTVALFSASYLGTAQDPVAPGNKVLYQRTGIEGTIIGTVAFVGEVPQRKMIDMSADPVCVEMNSESLTEDALVKDGKVANVIVYVKSDSVLDLYSFEEPDDAAVLAHKGCRYEPHVLGVRVGQRLEISSGDPTHHNTHPRTMKNAEWNQTQAPGAPPLVKTFSHAETFIPFKDNQHPWEKAWLGVFSHPFFAITDGSGRYRIEGLPPGVYTLVAWQERFGEKTIQITVRSGATMDVDFTFETSSKQ